MVFSITVFFSQPVGNMFAFLHISPSTSTSTFYVRINVFVSSASRFCSKIHSPCCLFLVGHAMSFWGNRCPSAWPSWTIWTSRYLEWTPPDWMVPSWMPPRTRPVWMTYWFTIPLLSNHFKRQTWANESNPHQLHGVISPDTRLFSIGSELGSLVGSQSERDEAYRFSCHEATVFLKNLPPLAVDKHTTCIDEDDSLMKSRRWVKMSKLFCSLRATAVFECIWYIWSNMMKTLSTIAVLSFFLGGWG